MRALVTWMNFDPADPATGGLLADAGLELRVAPKTGARTSAEVGELARDCVAAIVSTDPFDAGVFEQARQLRVIARIGVGTDSVDLEAATRAGVAVAITPGVNESTTADHTVALLLAVIRRVVENDRSVRSGEWNRAADLTAWELGSSTVGVVGYGKIGRGVARRLASFGAEILACDPLLADGDEQVEVVALDELLRRADVVTLHAPLNGRTRGLIGARELELMGPEAILVNTARGALVDEGALIAALEQGLLRGAALDVFEAEPPSRSSLTEMDHVVLSPHIGGLSDRSIQRMLEAATRQVLDLLSGDGSAATVVNPEALLHPKHATPILEATPGRRS